MNRLIRTCLSSIGKKFFMALTGLVFCSFVAMHLGGNLSIYGGKSYFTSYAEHLHTLGVLITFSEWALLGCAVIHIILGATLFLENVRARPVRYVVKKNAGGRTWASALMPYTGLYLVIFILIHLFTFHFVEHSPQTTFALVADTFSSAGYVLFYLFSMAVAAFHVKHGLWSAFQTLGGNHPTYTPLIEVMSLVFGIAVGVGFGSIPIFILAVT